MYESNMRCNIEDFWPVVSAQLNLPKNLLVAMVCTIENLPANEEAITRTNDYIRAITFTSGTFGSALVQKLFDELGEDLLMAIARAHSNAEIACADMDVPGLVACLQETYKNDDHPMGAHRYLRLLAVLIYLAVDNAPAEEHAACIQAYLELIDELVAADQVSFPAASFTSLVRNYMRCGTYKTFEVLNETTPMDAQTQELVEDQMEPVSKSIYMISSSSEREHDAVLKACPMLWDNYAQYYPEIRDYVGEFFHNAVGHYMCAHEAAKKASVAIGAGMYFLDPEVALPLMRINPTSFVDVVSNYIDDHQQKTWGQFAVQHCIMINLLVHFAGEGIHKPRVEQLKAWMDTVPIAEDVKEYIIQESMGVLENLTKEAPRYMIN